MLGCAVLSEIVLVQPGVVGVCEVVREAYPDHTQFDSDSPKYDPKSTAEKPRWFMVDVKWVRPSKTMLQHHLLSTSAALCISVELAWP